MPRNSTKLIKPVEESTLSTKPERFSSAMTGIRLTVAVLVFSCGLIPMVNGCMANPGPFRDRQPNGTLTPPLFLSGDDKFHYLTTEDGYTVIQDQSTAAYMFARRDESNGCLAPSEYMVGDVLPTEVGIERSIMPTQQARLMDCHLMCEEYDDDGNPGKSSPTDFGIRNRLLQAMNGPTVLVKNLVLLIRFKNHYNRNLPLPSEMDVLFNHNGPHSTIAPGGSIRDVFLVNSYGMIDVQSTIVGWLDLPENEEHYAAGTSGRSFHILEAVRDALELADAQIPFAQFDANGDGTIDILTLVHSGYGAEVGGTDEDNQMQPNRIWSHKWGFPSSQHFFSQDKIRVNKYSISTALWGRSGSSIARIGTIAHEIGHVLGLPDLYGGSPGNGVGSFGIMGNSWGIDGSQRFPPIMCPWSKLRLGWVAPLVVSMPQRVELRPSAQFAEIAIIYLGSNTEYLLIENRQPVLFDQKLNNGGLAIWHIDEEADHSNSAFPGLSDWPQNHYQVALVQADGFFQLERGMNRGHGSDLFGPDGPRSSLLPSSLSGNVDINTDAYQGAVVRESFVSIYDMTSTQLGMSFLVSFDGSTNNFLTSSPTAAPTINSHVLETNAAGGNGANGIMFDVVAKKDVSIFGIGIRLYSQSLTMVQVWTRQGTWQGFQQRPSAWSKITESPIQGKGFATERVVMFSPLLVHANQSRALYVTVKDANLVYSDGLGVGSVLAQDDSISILVGAGQVHLFSGTYFNRQWSGSVLYSQGASGDQSSPSPSTSPTTSPTLAVGNGQDFEGSKILHTLFVGGAEQAGNMFDILTFDDIVITGFTLHISLEEEVMIEVYTREGSFAGHENDCDNWIFHGDFTVQGQGTGRMTIFDEGRLNPIFVPRAQIQALYITVKTSSGNGMRYSRGSQTGDLVAADTNLAIFEGVGKGYPCGATFQHRVWNGAIHYTPVTEYNSTLPTYAPTTSPLFSGSTLETTFIGGRQSAGIMFDIEPKRDLVVNNLSLNIDSTEEVHIEIHKAINQGISHDDIVDDQSSWAQIGDCHATGEGRGQPTLLPDDCFNSIVLTKNHVLAIYVTLRSNHMRYSLGAFFNVAGSNDDMTVTKGIGRGFRFGAQYPNRVFNGAFHYEVMIGD